MYILILEISINQNMYILILEISISVYEIFTYYTNRPIY